MYPLVLRRPVDAHKTAGNVVNKLPLKTLKSCSWSTWRKATIKAMVNWSPFRNGRGDEFPQQEAALGEKRDFGLKHETCFGQWNVCVVEPCWLYFVSPILGPHHNPHPFLCDWASAYSQGMCPSQISCLSSFNLAFIWYENWKNAFCWCRWWMVIRLPGRRKCPNSCHCWLASCSVVRFCF